MEWGLHLCMLLAFLEDDETVDAAHLAEFHELPLPYMRKGLQSMARAGIVKSVRGPGGGYRLARSAKDVTFLDIVEAIEGSTAAFSCTEIRRKGPTGLADDCYPAACAIARTMWAAEHAWQDRLKVSLYDITDGLAALAESEQHSLAMNWLRSNARRSTEPQ